MDDEMKAYLLAQYPKLDAGMIEIAYKYHLKLVEDFGIDYDPEIVSKIISPPINNEHEQDGTQDHPVVE